MNSLRQRSVFKAKAVVCIALIVNVNYWSGCGQNVIALPDGTYRIILSSGHQLSQALRNSQFEGASAIVVDTRTNSFRIEFPDSTRFVSGSYTADGAIRDISRLVIGRGNEQVSLNIDKSRHITQIGSSNGAVWNRPQQWDTSSGQAIRAGTSFHEANADLLAAAQSLQVPQSTANDQSGTSTAATGGAKNVDASFDLLTSVLLASFLYGYFFWSSLIFLIEVIAGVSLVI